MMFWMLRMWVTLPSSLRILFRKGWITSTSASYDTPGFRNTWDYGRIKTCNIQGGKDTRDQNRTQKRKHKKCKAKEPKRGKNKKIKACRIQDFYVSVPWVHRSSSSSVNWNGTIGIFHHWQTCHSPSRNCRSRNFKCQSSDSFNTKIDHWMHQLVGFNQFCISVTPMSIICFWLKISYSYIWWQR